MTVAAALMVEEFHHWLQNQKPGCLVGFSGRHHSFGVLDRYFRSVFPRMLLSIDERCMIVEGVAYLLPAWLQLFQRYIGNTHKPIRRNQALILLRWAYLFTEGSTKADERRL